MPDHATALADLAESVGRALVQYSQAIRPRPATDDTASPSPLAPAGKRQRAALELAGIHTEAGLSAAEIASGVGITQPNAYSLATRMVEAGWLVQVADAEPRRWRSVEGQ